MNLILPNEVSAPNRHLRLTYSRNRGLTPSLSILKYTEEAVNARVCGPHPPLRAPMTDLMAAQCYLGTAQYACRMERRPS